MDYLEYYTNLYFYLNNILDRLNSWSQEHNENKDVITFFIERKEQLDEDVLFQLKEYALEQCSNVLREMSDSIVLYALPTLNTNETNAEYLEDCIEMMIVLAQVISSILSTARALRVREFNNYLILMIRHMNNEHDIAMGLYRRLL